MNSNETDPLMHEHLQGAIEEMRKVSAERHRMKGGEHREKASSSQATETGTGLSLPVPVSLKEEGEA